MEARNSHILSHLENKTAEFEDCVALGIKGQFGWKEFTYKGIGILSRKLARYLIEDLDIKKGEALAILSESKPEYGACVFASVLAGCITVPLDIKLSKYELKNILSDCLPTVMLVSQHYLQTALDIQKEIPSLKHIILIDEQASNNGIPDIYSLPKEYNAKWRQRSSKSTAFIIYTSGTTGAPKGVEIMFQNMTTQMEDMNEVIEAIVPGHKKVKILSILPMNHLFEMTVGFSTFLNNGHTIYYTDSLKPKDIMTVMKEKQIDFMIVVPAFLKLLKAGIEKEIKNMPKSKQRMFDLCYKLSKFIPSYRIRKLMFKDVIDMMGGKFFGCISGGAPADVHVAHFFNRIGVKVHQGYGLSETSPVVAINTDCYDNALTPGLPIKHVEVKIDEATGELMVKGPSVMKGYHNQPELTAQVLEPDGWLHTGDIAHLDKKGHIFITGRIKNMIVLSGGKKVFPEEVELVLEKSDYIAEICVLGISRSFGSKDGTEEVTAVVVPKSDLYNEHSEEDVEKMIKADIKVLSQNLATYKRPTNIIIRREELPRTTTRKVKRKELKEAMTV